MDFNSVESWDVITACRMASDLFSTWQCRANWQSVCWQCRSYLALLASMRLCWVMLWILFVAEAPTEIKTFVFSKSVQFYPSRRVLMRNCTDHVLPRALVQVTVEKIMLHRSCIAVILLDLYILTCQLTGVILHRALLGFMLQFQFTMLNILKREFGRYWQLAMLPLRFLLWFPPRWEGWQDRVPRQTYIHTCQQEHIASALMFCSMSTNGATSIQHGVFWCAAIHAQPLCFEDVACYFFFNIFAPQTVFACKGSVPTAYISLWVSSCHS